VFHRLGIRTTREINHERFAPKALRGDFGDVSVGEESEPQERARGAIQAAERRVRP